MQPRSTGQRPQGPKPTGGGPVGRVFRSLKGGQILTWAWIPIPVFLVLLGLTLLIGSPDPVGPPFLREVLNLVFGQIVPVWVAVLAGANFLRSRSVPILFFGSGLFLFALANFLSGAAYLLTGDLNVGLTIFTIGHGLAGILHLLAAGVAWSAGDWKVQTARFPLGIGFGAIVLIGVGLTVLAIFQVFPPFYGEGAGATTLRRAFLLLTMLLFSVASIVLLAVSHRLEWSFGRWYGFALALIALGMLGVALAPQVGSPIGWVGRAAQALGGLYLLAAVWHARYTNGYWEPITYSALHESEERFRALAKATWEGVAIGQNGVITDVNDQLSRMLGYRMEELRGRSIPSLIPPERADQVMAGLLSEAEVAMEHPMIRKDGSEILVESYGRTLPGRKEATQLWAIRDITIRKRQEKALRDSEEGLRALFDNMGEGMGAGELVCDDNGQVRDIRFIRINRAFQTQTGVGEELVGKPFSTVLPNLEREWIEMNARVVQSGHPERFERYNRDTQRHYEGVSYSLGKGRFAVLFRDITERNRQEQALRRITEERERHLVQLKAILNQMTEGLLIYDPQGHLVEINPAALGMYGFQDAEEVRERLRDTVSAGEIFEMRDMEGNVVPSVDWPVSRVLRGESFTSYLLRVHRIDTDFRWITSFGGSPVYDEKGNLLVAIVTSRDVTEQQEAQEAVKRSRDQLEQRVLERTAELQQRADQLARLTSELTLAEQRERKRLAQVLHDHLQQLLVGARFGLHLTSRELGAKEREGLDTVDNLLNEAIEASRSLTVELSPPILHEGGLAAALEWLARWMGKTHGLEVAVEVDSGLVVDREDVRILVFQAARELLLNVLKHAKVKTARMGLSRQEGDQLQVVVQDEGVGFDVEAVLGKNKGKEGYGLFSIKERLDLLGGRLTIESTSGKGTRSTLVAPLWPEGGSAREKERIAARQRGERRPTKTRLDLANKIRLLLVDDHAVVRQGLSVLLKSQEDVEIVGEAEDGAMAVDRARELHPDVILMDFSLPQMDGVEATRLIHDEMPDVQIIGLSMYEASDRADAMLEAGAVAYLCKSGKSEQLMRTIRSVTDPRRSA